MSTKPTVWIVSLEWNRPPSEVTGDTGIVGVFASKAPARACRKEERQRFDAEGLEVWQFSNVAGRYCVACGEKTITAAGVAHVCDDAEEHFCDYCGAELKETGGCDNDHDAWDIDVHCTEHEVKS